MIDPIFILILIFILFPFILMNYQKMRKNQKEIIELLKETNRLLSEAKN